ncbi:biotin carboxyl carrier protein [Pedobacter cryoconitis]|uniref:Biotin carboxyl carrier protein n=1 Tax=Pedobacter cryoconitis TaxID=188932 RepID=A0A7W9DKQ2_9SPHI|nr:biotin/lipoyl-containing protein [Pedobacter cryoconitis]MBB5622418.1 biotin carboxyl carrier protein [Pedobacter cryoconitis]
MYKLKVNDTYNFDLSAVNDSLQLNGEAVPVDIRELQDGHLHFIYKNKSYNAEVVSENHDDKTSVIKINGKLYEVGIEDQFDSLLKAMGMAAGSGKVAKEVKAPMPGLVLNISVVEGQEIKKGDNLLILEAMKMENMLKSVTEGVVKKIYISKGDKVEKNQVLIEFV